MDYDLERFVPEPYHGGQRSEFSRDRARIFHSAALRRLGSKTQVLNILEGDFSRTRLTHSLEVAQIGRALASALGCDPDLVDAACLAHDLGHPPFGHNGEYALNEVAKEIGGFEGNAQTFRLLTRLEAKSFGASGKSVGLNLTRATLDAAIKYPWTRPADLPVGKACKFGIYADDVEVFEWYRSQTPPQARSIESQIMDISDDIGYSVHDVEDAIYRRSLDLGKIREDQEATQIIQAVRYWYDPAQFSDEQLEQAYTRLVSMPQWLRSFNGSRPDIAALKNLTSEIIGRFVSAIHDATRQNAQRHGLLQQRLIRYQTALLVPPQISAEILVLKGMAVHYVMQPRETDPDYLRERTLLFDLCAALIDGKGKGISPEYAEDYRQAADDSARLRVVIDQVASLTDHSASRLHAQLCGLYSQV